MKTTIRFSLLLAFLATAFVSPVSAQDIKKEMASFIQQYQDAYNKKDSKALKGMFTKDATRTGTDGKVLNGSDAIADFLAEWLKNDVTVAISPGDASAEKDGSAIGTGTYHLTGTSTTGEKIDRKGSYHNVLVKEDGQWKISKQVLKTL